MADLGKIQGPSGPPESSRPGGRSRKPDSDKFKDEMRKVDEVSKTDPDEAKKRKRPEETLREEEINRARPTESSKPPEKAASTFKTPEKQSTSNLPESAPVEGTPVEEEAEESSPVEKSSSEERKGMGEHEKSEHTFISAAKQQSQTEEMVRSRYAEIDAGKTMPAAPEPLDEEKKNAVLSSSDTREIAINAPSSMAPTEPTKVEEPEAKEELSLPEDPPPPYTHLHPDVLDIFERLVGAMILLNESGIRETTIIIASSKEKPSIFDGAQIKIKEYSTAPKQFNIELSGTSKAVDLFRDNMQDLKAALDDVPYAFKVNRLETSIKT
jgi:hypothetical protein